MLYLNCFAFCESTRPSLIIFKCEFMSATLIMQIHTLISCGTGSSRSQFPSTLAKLANTGSVANAKLSLKRKVLA